MVEDIYAGWIGGACNLSTFADDVEAVVNAKICLKKFMERNHLVC